MNLTDIIKKYLRTKDSGLLSVKLEDQSYLLKVYFNDGDIVFLSLGTCKNEPCITKLSGLTPLEYFFVKDAKPPAQSNTPLTDKIAQTLGMSEGIQGRSSSSPGSGGSVQSSLVKAAEKDFIDLIGPIGGLIVENIYSKVSYKRGSAMSVEDFSFFIESLLKEIPPQHKDQFADKYKKE